MAAAPKSSRYGHRDATMILIAYRLRQRSPNSSRLQQKAATHSHQHRQAARAAETAHVSPPKLRDGSFSRERM